MEGRRVNQVPLSVMPMFSCARELANLVVTSNLSDRPWTEILKLKSDQIALPSPVRPTVYQPSPKCKIVAFVSSPGCTQGPPPQEGDLVHSPHFEFLHIEENKSVSINKAALDLFASINNDDLSRLTQLTENEGQLIITGHSLGGSVASLFTLYLLNSMDLSKTKCRPICITFGSPLVGNFGLQHSIWNSFFLHVVSNQDRVPGLFLPPSRSSQTTVYNPFGTYLFCSELGCACFDDPDLILKLLKIISSEVPEGLQDVDYGAILRNLKDRAICKGLPQVGERFADPFSAGVIMELETIGFNQTKLLHHNIYINIEVSAMEKKARILTEKNKAIEAEKLNKVKIYMAQLEWYKKKSKDGKGYYDCFKDEVSKRDIHIEQFKENLTKYWKDMVAQVQRKPQKEATSFRTRWLYAGTTYRRMVEPLDIAAFYRDGGREYIKDGRSLHYKLLQQFYENDDKTHSGDDLESKKRKVSAILTEDSCFWAHVEEAILACESLKSAKSTLEKKKSSQDYLVEFGKYVMKQIRDYAVSPEIFLENSSFMKWWKVYEEYIDTFGHSDELISFMKRRSFRQYG